MQWPSPLGALSVEGRCQLQGGASSCSRPWPEALRGDHQPSVPVPVAVVGRSRAALRRAPVFVGSRLRNLLQKLCVVIGKPRSPVPLFRSPSQRRLRTTHSLRGLTELTSRPEVPMQEKLLIGLRRLAWKLGEDGHRSLFSSSGFQRASTSLNPFQAS